MRGLFDTRPALVDPTGIGRYARTLPVVAAGGLGPHELLDGEAVLRFASATEEELLLPALLEREQVDVFHSPLLHLPALLPCQAVVTLHDAIPATHPTLTTPAFREVWAQSAEAASRAAAVVCPTAAAAEEVALALGLPRERVHVVPETPDPVFRSTSTEEQQAARRRHGLADEPFFLALGALEPRKNPTLLLEALRRRPELPGALFVGPAGQVDVLGEAERLGVARRVRYLGVLPDAELVALLGAAEALAFPTLAEGFGLPVIEAFATGTPVVASAVPAVTEVAGEAALLVPPGDGAALADALGRVVADRELARALAARGQARLEAFSPVAVRAGLVRLYDALARKAA